MAEENNRVMKYKPIVRSITRTFVTHLHNTRLKMHFLLLEYDAPFERETHPLYNDTKIIILSQTELNLWINNYLYV